jgi:lipid-A-disaccharide synthase
MKNILIIAGEASGDAYGANIIEKLRKENKDIKITAVSGPKMRALNVKSIMKVEELSVMGFYDVIISFRKIFILWKRLRDHILKTKYCGVIFIDFPDFNLRLARSLKKLSFKGKLIHYVCPSIWAWRKNRKKFMEKNLDHLLTIFPFEQFLFKKSSLKIDYVGNPTLELIKSYKYKNDFIDKFKIDSSKKTISIFPGSRLSEIKDNLPYQIKALTILGKKSKFNLCISIANRQVKKAIEKICTNVNIRFIDSNYSYDLMQNSYLAIATSGTVTLELAIHKTPSVVSYKIGLFNYFLSKYIFNIRLKFYSLANIVANRNIFPEFYSINPNVEDISNKLLSYINDENLYKNCLDNCYSLEKELRSHKETKSIAKIILK